VYPLISYNFNNAVPGKLTIPNGASKELLAQLQLDAINKYSKELAAQADLCHKQGRILRYWATADDPKVWDALKALGVDLVNVDDLEGYRSYNLGSLDASNTMGAPGALEAATKDGSLNFIPGIDVAQWALLPQINPYTAPLGDVVQAVTTVYDSSDSTKVDNWAKVKSERYPGGKPADAFYYYSYVEAALK
jgi:hypothetical protein